MGGHVNTVWTDEQSEVLITLLAQGKSFSQIAEVLNAQFDTTYSRNAVCGKGFRLQIRAPQKVKAPPKIRKRRAETTIKPPPHMEEIQLRCAEIEPRHITLDQLETDDCRYPFGDGPFTFCGHPQLNDSSYCASHFHLTKMHSRTISEAVTDARARRMRGINFRRALLEGAT